MIDFFDVQPKTVVNGITLTDITKLINIKNDLSKYSITTKMEPWESFNDIAYRLYGDDKVFWVLQELNKRMVFAPMLSDEDFRRYMEKFNVSCALPNGGITALINVIGSNQFPIRFYQYDELIFEPENNKLINFDLDGNSLTFEDGTERVYIGGARLVRNTEYVVGVDAITDMQYIEIIKPDFAPGTQVIVRIYEQIQITKIDTIRNQIVLEKQIEKPYYIETKQKENIVEGTIVNAVDGENITGMFQIKRYADCIHHYNYNGLAYNTPPRNVDPLKLFEYTWEEYEIAVNEEKRDIVAIKPEYKADMIRIIQEQTELLTNV
jgi:hypothetical protein